MSIQTASGHKFRSCGHVAKKQSLFTVAPGVDLADALNSASDLLDATLDSIHAAGMGDEPLTGNSAWLVLHAIESAKSVIDALHDAAEDAETAARKEGGAQ